MQAPDLCEHAQTDAEARMEPRLVLPCQISLQQTLFEDAEGMHVAHAAAGGSQQLASQCWACCSDVQRAAWSHSRA